MKDRNLKTMLLCILTILIFNKKSYSQIGKQDKSIQKFYIGVDNSGDKFQADEFFNFQAMQALGVNFIIYKYRGPQSTITEEAIKLKKLLDRAEEKKLNIVFNVESGNWSLDMMSKDGHNWVKGPNGLHQFRFPPHVLKIIHQSPAYWGTIYDELEHSQITRNLTIALRNPGIDRVSLAEPNGMDFKSADQAVYNGAKSLVNYCHEFGGGKILTEHVWPVLFHNFARAGMTPAYKQMKENWSNVWAACAMGACLQYSQEMWACLDFWNYNTYPGHSAKELQGNLLFAYWAGADKTYVENIGSLYSLDENQNIKLSDRGEVFRNFVKNYIPSNMRPYTFRDFEPQIAIIRFDDTEWGQGNNVYCTVEEKGQKIDLYWKDMLFGAYNLHTSPASEEWIKAWHTITHGMVKKESLSWNAGNYYRDIPHRSFAPVNSPIVFDDKVTIDHLKTLKLAFLCGLFISNQTLSDVSSLVHEKGLVVVTSPRFAPQKWSAKYTGGTKEFKDGKGKWILTDDMASEDVKKQVEPLIGKNDEIVYKFRGNKKVTMKISPDGNELDIQKTNF